MSVTLAAFAGAEAFSLTQTRRPHAGMGKASLTVEVKSRLAVRGYDVQSRQKCGLTQSQIRRSARISAVSAGLLGDNPEKQSLPTGSPVQRLLRPKRGQFRGLTRRCYCTWVV